MELFAGGVVAYWAAGAILLLITFKTISANSSTLPGPFNLPFIGSLVQSKLGLDVILDTLSGLKQRYGAFYTLNLYHQRWYVISSHKLIAESAQHQQCYHSGVEHPEYRALMVLCPQSLISLPFDDQWKDHRRAVTGMFTERYMQYYSEIVSQKADAYVEQWKNFLSHPTKQLTKEDVFMEGNRPLCDIERDHIVLLSSVTYDILMVAIFGLPSDVLHDTQLKKETATMSANVLEGLSQAQKLPRGLWPAYAKHAPHMKRTMGEVNRSVTQPLMDEIEAKRNGTSLHDPGNNSVLSVLRGAKRSDGSPFSNEAMTDELFGLVMAGHETTATTLAWTFWLLCDNVDLQERLHREAMEVGVEGGVDLKKAASLTLHKHTMCEALRLYPTVPITIRTVCRPFTLDGHTLKAGGVLFVNLAEAGRDPEDFEDPDQMKPDRWEDPALHRKLSSFGFGHRVCVGRRFAELEYVVLLAKTLREFRIERDDRDPRGMEVKQVLNITLSPSHLPVRFLPR